MTSPEPNLNPCYQFPQPPRQLIASLTTALILLQIHLYYPTISASTNRHVIKFRVPNLYPEGLAWDPSAHHFIVGSIHNRTLHSVFNTGVTHTLLTDYSLPTNSSFLGLTVDPTRHRLHAVVHSKTKTSTIGTDHPSPIFNALVTYDLRSMTQIFISLLPSFTPNTSSADVANAVTVDHDGNAYVTNSGNNFIWKVSVDGEFTTIFSKSPLFFRFDPVDPDAPYGSSGINGVAYVNVEGYGYLLVVQSNTGKLFRVDAVNGAVSVVDMEEDMVGGDGMVLGEDGTVTVVTPLGKAWVVKSDDCCWSKGKVVERIKLAGGRDDGFPTSVVVGEHGRVYVVYGYVWEAWQGNLDEGREWFRIEEIRKRS